MTTDPTLTCVLDARASLGECPTWSAREQVLYWVDINEPALHRFDPRTGLDRTMPMPASIGSFALRERGGFVVALRTGIFLADADGRIERKVADAPYDPHHHRFNDGRCDPRGRFLVGTMNENRDAPSAALYRLDPDFSLHRLLGDITISNGLATRRRTSCAPTTTTRRRAPRAQAGSSPAGWARRTAPTAPAWTAPVTTGWRSTGAAR